MNLAISAQTLQSPLALPAQSKAAQASLSSSDILRGQKTVDIHHNGATYKLQATRLGKLILTK